MTRTQKQMIKNMLGYTIQQQYITTNNKSGLAVKKMIDCGAGVVDADYRGNVGVVLFNFGPTDFEVSVGDRIAQLILEHISMVPAVQVTELTETERGAGGFGSTGVSKTLNVKEGDAEEPEKKVQRTISPNNSGEAPMEP